MILSADPSNPYYTPDYFEYIVRFNGVPISHCITADTDKGIAIVYDTNEDGNVIVAFGRPRTKQLNGHIMIIRKDGKPSRYSH
jgi:hypothetical protein